ncbi:zinc metalloproteinase nas-14-like [Hydractinia symbiolongicarpus]|uniref:zinc metalloproteinase nas-14-like n=1 Tax=Hydractinia symbiolongicarpus TaxID=13093 RepID=UPI002550191B|nr:zinc metalloproteinase nas-14-like [Hydractinia symbiolongicarpus]
MLDLIIYTPLIAADKEQLFFGDEKLTEEQIAEYEGRTVNSEIQNGLTRKSDGLRWPNNVLHYTVSPQFSATQKRIIQGAISKIESNTCIRFTEHPIGNAPVNHVEIFPGKGCWSFVGRQNNKKQQLSLQSNGCVHEYIAIHELLHALGVYHEQSRNDRDEYVTINVENIKPNLKHNFDKKKTDSLGVEYDPYSVMHYSNYAFSNNKRPTITWKRDPNLRFGGRALTQLDILQLNRFYECNNPVTSTTTTTTTTTTRRPTTVSTTTRRPTTTTTTTRRPTTTTTTRSTTTTKTTRRPTTTTTTTRRPTTTTTTTRRPMTTTTTRSTTTTKTTRRPTTTTTGPTGEVCADKSYYCGRPDACFEYPSECPRRCGQCSSPQSDQCKLFKDLEGRSSCMAHGEANGCVQSNAGLKDRIRKVCTLTCCERGELYE